MTVRLSMDPKPIVPAAATPDPRAGPPPSRLRTFWHGVRARLLGGLLLVLPILITFRIIHWIYSNLEKYVIDPLALFVLWKVEGRTPETETLPVWFEQYAAPAIAIVIAVVLLYFLGFFVRSRVRRGVDWMLLRLPVISL